MTALPVPARKPRLVITADANPLAALELLPGWWIGKAQTRRTFAQQDAERGLDKLADEHLRAASEYERKLKTTVQP